MLQVGDLVVINKNAAKGLPNDVGKMGIVSLIPQSINYEYEISLGKGNIVKVKADEISKLNNYSWFDVIYHATNEIVMVLQHDLVNYQISILFPGGGARVVSFSDVRLYELGSDDMEINEKMEKVKEMYNKSRDKNTDHELHAQIISEIHNTYKIKNADYGNSFGEQYQEHGLLSAVIRLDDKMRRLKQLNKQEAKVKNESIRDTVLDLANYAIMTVMELDKAQK